VNIELALFGLGPWLFAADNYGPLFEQLGLDPGLPHNKGEEEGKETEMKVNGTDRLNGNDELMEGNFLTLLAIHQREGKVPQAYNLFLHLHVSYLVALGIVSSWSNNTLLKTLGIH
jgi:hypothetical protein